MDRIKEGFISGDVGFFFICNAIKIRCFACCMIILSVLIFSCNKRPAEQESVQEPAKAETETSIQPEITGAQLARSYCSECHRFPSPELLDKSTWEKYILPRMGNYFGIYDAENL